MNKNHRVIGSQAKRRRSGKKTHETRGIPSDNEARIHFTFDAISTLLVVTIIKA